MKKSILSMLVLLMGLTLYAQVVKVYKGCPNIPVFEVTDADSIVVRGICWNVQPSPDTADVPEDAIHVYEAVEICSKLQSGQSTDSVYRVKGWISNLDSAKNAECIKQYGNVYFYMADSYNFYTKNQTKFYAFQILGLGRSQVRSLDAIKEGDYVVVECHLCNYAGVAETVGQGDGFIYSSTNPNIAARPKAINVTCAEAKEIALALKENNTPTDEYYCVTGYISKVQGNVSKGKQTFWMSDAQDTAKTLQAYYANIPDKVTPFNVGQHVKLYGHIMKYNTTPEIKNGDVEFIESAKVSQRKESVIWHYNGNTTYIYLNDAQYPIFEFSGEDSVVFKEKPKIPETYDNPVIADNEVNSIVGQGTIMNLDDFVSTYMTEQGNWLSEDHPYPDRAVTSDSRYYVFSVDTIPAEGVPVFLRARIADKFKAPVYNEKYTSYVLQQVIGDQQQTIRMMAKLSDSLQIGQEVLIQVNGLSVGRYADQPTLCMPHYYAFTYANYGEAKCGWRPGPIRPRDRNGKLWLIGQPDASKIMYESITIADYKNITDTAQKSLYRKLDGHMVEISGIHFTGQYVGTNAKLDPCTDGDPRVDEISYYFAPTTHGLNFPQARIFSDGTNTSLTSCYEWFPIALVQLPESEYKGSMRGILTFMADNAAKLSMHNVPNQYNWSIMIQSVEALDLSNTEGKAWVPVLFDPNLK